MLRRLGISKGDVVAVALPNCPEYPIVFFGALALGAKVTTINISYTAEEIARQLADSGAHVLVGEPFLTPTLDAALNLYRKPTHFVTNGPSFTHTAINLWQVFEDPSIPFVDPVILTGEEPAVLPYSSGTTGPPKGVLTSHNGFSSHVPTTMHPYFTLEEGEDQDVYMCILPFFHIYGMGPIMTCGLHVGAKLLVSAKFDPKAFVRDISEHKVTVLHLVPTLLNFLLNSPAATPKALRRLRNVLCGAAPVPETAVAALKDRIGPSLLFQIGFGMTEVAVASKVPVNDERMGTIGQLLPNVTAKVVDTDTGALLPPLANGEICIKTPSMMAGYHNNPSATAETIDEEGWLHTGDVGHYDLDGFFKIVDRTKELIKVKGLQVSPSELENTILQHPDVADVGVVGVPHDRMGEAPRAYIVPKKSIKEQDIHRFLEPRLAPHKRLAGGVVFVSELPKSATGKLLRRELKKLT
ncbi:4-coumarate--CoA ligase-like [Penaeus japonicus]|uniref:4-coumarate--CoA ligase-like n=1 Tax=Penaeus japonicus TaxID=27405 RepID=UPI001C70DD0E|nr:4-coumarate--CoA ligase-like [Penaeus japonicus]